MSDIPCWLVLVGGGGGVACGSVLVISYLQYLREIQCQSPRIINTITQHNCLDIRDIRDIRDLADLTSQTEISFPLKVLNIDWLFSQIWSSAPPPLPPTSTMSPLSRAVSTVITNSVSLGKVRSLRNQTSCQSHSFTNNTNEWREREREVSVIMSELQTCGQVTIRRCSAH